MVCFNPKCNIWHTRANQIASSNLNLICGFDFADVLDIFFNELCVSASIAMQMRKAWLNRRMNRSNKQINKKRLSRWLCVFMQSSKKASIVIWTNTKCQRQDTQRRRRQTEREWEREKSNKRDYSKEQISDGARDFPMPFICQNKMA